MRRAKAPRARQTDQAEHTDVRGENKKAHRHIASVVAGRGGQTWQVLGVVGWCPGRPLQPVPPGFDSQPLHQWKHSIEVRGKANE